MFGNFLQTDFICLFFFFPIIPLYLFIFWRYQTDNRFQRRDNLLLLHLPIRHDNSAVFDSFCGFNNDMLTSLYHFIARVKKVYFSCLTKTNSYNCLHKFLRFLYHFNVKSINSIATSKLTLAFKRILALSNACNISSIFSYPRSLASRDICDASS